MFLNSRSGTLPRKPRSSVTERPKLLEFGFRVSPKGRFKAWFPSCVFLGNGGTYKRWKFMSFLEVFKGTVGY